MKKDKACYTIGVVARMYDIHPQTLRLYEREGLLKPSRTQGNTRLYSDEDLKRLEFILFLTRELGVNLAGVDVILNLKSQVEELQNQVDQLLEFIKQEFSKVHESEEFSKSIVNVSKRKVMKVEDLIMNKVRGENVE